MKSTVSSVLNRLRNPSYTGSNRCVPCTVVNLLIGAVVAVVLGLEWPLIGVVAFAVAVVVVALQGYLVPGTPALTARYLPDQILRWFTHDETTSTAAAPDEGELDVERLLVDREILRPCVDGDDLCLDADFARSWRTTAARIDPDLHAETAAPVVAVDPATASVVHGRNGVYLEGDDYRYQWMSRGALLADVAADQVFTDRVSEWSTLPVAHRLTVLRGVRAFLDVCPLCDGTVRIGTETVRSCCRSAEVIAVACGNCGERFAELDARTL